MVDLYASLAAIGIVAITMVLLVLLVPFIRDTVIPWMQEKRLYALVSRFVEAAEKLADTGAIDKGEKKNYVLEMLQQLGFEITPVLEGFVESAVSKLDRAFAAIWSGVLDSFDEWFDLDDDDECECVDPEPNEENAEDSEQTEPEEEAEG